MIITHHDQMAKLRDVETSDPVFQNVGQMLWIAYALEHFRESPKTTLMTLLKMINDGQYTEPIKLSGVNMSGLSDQEKHAQGAFVRAAVCDLPKMPRCYVWGAYSMVPNARRHGMLVMAKYVGERIEGRDRLYCGPLVWHIMAPPKDRKQATAHWISGKFQVPLRSVERDIATAKELLYVQKSQAFSMLEQKFSGTGLIP
jgi:hypothetical protein